MRNLFAAAICALFLSLNAVAAEHPVWLTYGPDGEVSARTIVDGTAACPHIEIDGRREQMRVRSLPGKLYPVTSCEATLPAGAIAASIDGRALPVAKLGRTEKVAILGDTGCRRKVSDSGKPSIQDCNDPAAWPFKQVADSIADWDPDLILNVGDYYYREAICRNGKCVKSTYDWSRWNADWFTPAAKALPSAPWILVRGNHEDCDRAAEGWFRFLDPRDYLWENAKTCQSNLQWTPPYDVRVGNLRFIVIDSATISDWLNPPDPKQVEIMANQLRLYTNKAAGAWMMLHHPFWGYGSWGPETQAMWTAWNATGADAPNPALMLTGHMHLLEMISFSDNRIPQLVVGNGGTALDPPPTDAIGKVIAGRTVTEFYGDDDFGWIAATRDGNGWIFDIRDEHGKSKKTCGWKEGEALVCK